MSLYAIADLHLATDPAIGDKSMDMFGGAWVNHAERLKAIWLRLVEPEDTVLIPGDISWALKLEEAMADLAWIDALPGKKVLVRGNHDLWWASMKKMRGLFDSISFIQNDCYEGDEFVIMGSRGWLCPGDPEFSEEKDRKIYERELIRLRMSAESALKVLGGRTLVAATHFPPVNRQLQPGEITDIFSEAGVSIAVYGHLHGENAFGNGPSGNIGGVDYRLVSLDRLKAAPLRIL